MKKLLISFLFIYLTNMVIGQEKMEYKIEISKDKWSAHFVAVLDERNYIITHYGFVVENGEVIQIIGDAEISVSGNTFIAKIQKGWSLDVLIESVPTYHPRPNPEPQEAYSQGEGINRYIWHAPLPSSVTITDN